MQQITGQKLIRAAGYTVMLEEVGPNVVATGSGALNVTALTFFGSSISASWIVPHRRRRQRVDGGHSCTVWLRLRDFHDEQRDL
jgi:hypothetical protein